MFKTRHMVLLSLMVSQALILSIIEQWIAIPSVVPGVKLGLANIVTLIVIIFFGLKDALVVVTARCLLASMFGGGLALFPFSFVGGVLSALIMYLMYKRFEKVFSTIGISVAGSIMHNLGQLAVASIMMWDVSVFGYLPILLVSGIIMGCFVGVCTYFLVSALKKTRLFNKIQ
jgi:heptaprenyl diphosphate synthase